MNKVPVPVAAGVGVVVIALVIHSIFAAHQPIVWPPSSEPAARAADLDRKILLGARQAAPAPDSDCPSAPATSGCTWEQSERSRSLANGSGVLERAPIGIREKTIIDR